MVGDMWALTPPNQSDSWSVRREQCFQPCQLHICVGTGRERRAQDTFAVNSAQLQCIVVKGAMFCLKIDNKFACMRVSVRGVVNHVTIETEKSGSHSCQHPLRNHSRVSIVLKSHVERGIQGLVDTHCFSCCCWKKCLKGEWLSAYRNKTPA